MGTAGKKERDEKLHREVLETAPDFILTVGLDGPWIDYLCRHYGYTSRKLSQLFPSKSHIIDFILERHLKDAFEAVCVPGDWEGPAMDVLRGMSLELICYGSRHLQRHKIFLSEYERRPDAARKSLAQQLVYLTNNFHVALHAVTPAKKFARLRNAADILLGQLLHAPLWWPANGGCTPPSTTLDTWVCTQLGLVTGLKRPDHKRPSLAKSPSTKGQQGAWAMERDAACAPERKSPRSPKRNPSCAPKREASRAPERESACAPKRDGQS